MGWLLGSERSPREIAVSRRLPPGEFAMFGSKVLAEIPKSVFDSVCLGLLSSSAVFILWESGAC